MNFGKSGSDDGVRASYVASSWSAAVIMSSAVKRLCSSRNSQAPDPSQLYEDVNIETLDVETVEASEVCVKKEEMLDLNIYNHGNEVCVKKETLELDISNHENEVCVKKEETLELDISNDGNDLDNSPEVLAIKVEDPDKKDYLYCEVCKSFFFSKCEVHGPLITIPDTPVPMGVPDQARQTLPPGLEIQKSSIPGADLGVFNKAETVPVGVHFGPCQGELVDREEAMNSGCSSVICRSRQCDENMDAKREMHANWMRYVNCARNDEEKNLVAFQYRGKILYRCCRPINPGQELLVWYGEEYAKELSPAPTGTTRQQEVNNALQRGFSCTTCPLSYASEIYLHKHIQRCHYKEFVRLQESGEIKDDLQIPSEDYRRQTSSSDTLSTDTSHDDVHKEIHHCSDCGKSFGHQNGLKKHLCTNMGGKPHHCLQCGKSFYQQSDLKQHQRVHTGEKPYHCSQCEKSFTDQRNLRKHQRIHTGEKPHHCSQCGRSFSRQSHLQRHQRVHTGEKPYPCSQCGKNFTHQSNLQRHQRIHTGEKPYHCSLCGKSFTHQCNLQRHRRIHTGEKTHHCSQCAKTFTCSLTFKTHKCSNSEALHDLMLSN
ncbi:histone-lysine N-methyltransferase PRDM9-like isoform X2 [Neoarius graeffei]|uniref:histone-lysine N-methyltransferase PRDM9-like isoform X2 n=1 Tax=Neoarius graeffei TaxID=443677 RepID=UPI00298BEAF8|nr:histone-lysine N-methyltransferase PRDM9-like isoform X2 [Neoarius graeffei]